jgi:hypothetical protein
MAVLGSDGLDLLVDAVEEVSRTCVWGLMAYMNKFVLEKACSSGEFRA